MIRLVTYCMYWFVMYMFYKTTWVDFTCNIASVPSSHDLVSCQWSHLVYNVCICCQQFVKSHPHTFIAQSWHRPRVHQQLLPQYQLYFFSRIFSHFYAYYLFQRYLVFIAFLPWGFSIWIFLLSCPWVKQEVV